MRVARPVLTTAAIAALALPALASDTFRECKQLDGSGLTLDPETMELKKAGGEKLAYTVLDRQRIREISGWCNTGKGRFRFSTEVIGLTLGFKDGTTSVRRKFRCETSEDGTPAGLNCDREVRTIDFSAPAKMLEAYR